MEVIDITILVISASLLPQVNREKGTVQNIKSRVFLPKITKKTGSLDRAISATIGARKLLFFIFSSYSFCINLIVCQNIKYICIRSATY